jgi:hypothetical protein
MAGEVPMPPIKRPYAHYHVFAVAVFAFAVLSGLSACKTVDTSGIGPSPDSTSAGTATLRITNNLDVDPDSLRFFLFPGTATDFTTAANARLIGGVGMGATGVFTVPSGTWKLAYENGAHVLTAMRAEQTDEWVKSILAKDGDYSLILTSDNQNTIWDASFTTDPPLK